jgi:antitoxin ParD1/3/4
MTVTMNISLPEALRDHVQKRVAEGGYSNASDFVRVLIREDREKQAKEKLEFLLLEGIYSGEPEEATDEYWEALKADVAAEIANGKKA